MKYATMALGLLFLTVACNKQGAADAGDKGEPQKVKAPATAGQAAPAQTAAQIQPAAKTEAPVKTAAASHPKEEGCEYDKVVTAADKGQGGAEPAGCGGEAKGGEASCGGGEAQAGCGGEAKGGEASCGGGAKAAAGEGGCGGAEATTVAAAPTKGEGTPAKAEGAAAHFGAKFTMTDAMPIAKLLAEADKFTGKTVKVTARVSKVCKKKGCWMVLAGGKDDSYVRVSMHKYSFFVPKDCDGKDAVVEGTFRKVEIPESARKHLAEDGGEDPNKIKGAKVEYTLIATGIEIKG